MQSNSKNRISGIDVARGIAMICIVIGHLEGWDIWGIKKAVFPFHVPIFYLISGWFFRPEKGWKTFLIKKAKTLLVPYVTSSVLMALIGALVVWYFHGEPLICFRDWIYAMLYGAGDDAPRLLAVPQIGATWFLLSSFWGVVLLRAVRSLKPWMRPFAVVALFLLGNLTNKMIWPLAIQPGCAALLFMYIGNLAREWKDQLDGTVLQDPVAQAGIRMELKVGTFLVAAAGWLCMWQNFTTFWLVHADAGKGTLDILGSLCACWTVLVISVGLDKYVKILARPLAILGKYSIVMLCAHIIELNVIPWWYVLDKLQNRGMSEALRLPALLGLKFGWIFLFMFVVVTIQALHPLFGIRRRAKG